MKETIVLNGHQIMSSITDAGRGKTFDYDENSKLAGEKYKRLAYNGTAFIASPEIADAILNGDIASLTLIKSMREKLDENGDVVVDDEGNKIMVESLQLGGTATWKTLQKVAENSAVLEVAGDVARAKLAKQAGLNLADFFGKPEEEPSKATAAASAGEDKLHTESATK